MIDLMHEISICSAVGMHFTWVGSAFHICSFALPRIYPAYTQNKPRVYHDYTLSIPLVFPTEPQGTHITCARGPSI